MFGAISRYVVQSDLVSSEAFRIRRRRRVMVYATRAKRLTMHWKKTCTDTVVLIDGNTHARTHIHTHTGRFHILDIYYDPPLALHGLGDLQGLALAAKTVPPLPSSA